jgi:hypothetical protein
MKAGIAIWILPLRKEVFKRELLDMTTALHFKTRGLVHDYRS